ncbi:MAG: hypothetical protein SFW67_23865 [Myxococcaceae bacterium]|nr:hypothetical protein [Myxococcaceae bacterium]
MTHIFPARFSSLPREHVTLLLSTLEFNGASQRPLELAHHSA